MHGCQLMMSRDPVVAGVAGWTESAVHTRQGRLESSLCMSSIGKHALGDAVKRWPTLLTAPRALKEPVRCSLSSFR